MATQYSNKPIVTDGLVYALDFGNPKSYVSGSTTANSLKYETNPTFVTGSTSIPNSVSPVLFFTGSQWVERTGSFSVFNPNGTFTLSIVVNARTAGTLVSQTSSLGNLVSNVSPTSSAFGFANPNYTRGIQGLSTTGLNHLTYRYSSGSLDIFYNGTLVTASQATISLPTSSVVDEFYINGNNGLLNNFSGSLVAISVYSRALTLNEVQSNYTIARTRYGLTQEQNYTLDENAFLFLQSAGITDPIITGSIDTFVRGLKSASLWDKMIAIYPFVGTGSDGVNLTGSHKWNLKEPSLVTYPLSFTGSWNGSTSGSAPSGSNTNISTQVAPSNYYPFYNTQSAHISILSYDTPVSSSYLMGTGMTEDLAISTLAGDYGTPAAAYSVRKVRTAYSGALMDVRRSIDNVTQSIGFVSNGDLDTGSLLNFVRTEGNNFLPGAYSGLAAAYSLRRVSGSYTGSAIQANNGLIYKDIGFDANGNLDTGSLTSLVATGSNVLAGNYSGLAAAYSLRRVTSSYSGFAIEVQSGSVSQSIGFDSIGNLDTGSLLTFVGSGDGFVKTWYDQSGNNNHATQSVAANQPRIVYTGSIVTENGKPAIQFDGSNDYFTANTSFNQPVFVSLVVKNIKESSTYPYYLDSNSTGRFLLYVEPSGIVASATYTAGKILVSSITKTVPSLISVLYSGSSSFISIDSSIAVSGTIDTNNFDSPIYIGSRNTTAQNMQGSYQELIFWNSDQSSNRTYIENNINAYYNIYTTSSTSTENAFVSTWYDQSGNNRHATQTATGSQPLIVSSGSLVTDPTSSRPTLRFDGNSDYLDTNSFTTITQPLTTFVTYKLNVVSSFPYIVDFGNSLSFVRPYNGGGGHSIGGAGGELFFGSLASANITYLTYGLFSGSNGEIAINGSPVVTGSAGTGGAGQIRIGTAPNNNPSSYVNGTISEIVLYSTNQSTNRPLIENNINNYYNIYTGSNHGFVARWYDQSGNNNHATQTTAGSQPVIVLSGSILTTNNKPNLNFDGVDDNFSLVSTISSNTAYTAIEVNRRTDTSVNSVGFASPTGQPLVNFFLATTLYFNTQRLGTGYFATYSINSTNQQLLFSIDDKSSNLKSYLNQNLVINSLSPFGTTTFTDYNNIGIRSGYTKDVKQELIFYSSDQSSNREAISYGINNYYNIYPQTSSFATSSFTIQATPTAISGAINNKLTSGIPSSGPLGLITVSRTGSNSLTIARNGVTSSFAVPASGALSTGIYLGAINNNGLALGNSPLNLSFASVGTGLTGAEVSTYNRLVNNLKINTVSPGVVTNGLVLFLDAGNKLSYPESGQTWGDFSGNNNNSTLINGPTFDPTNNGSIVFDGVNDYMTVTTTKSLIVPGSMTYEIIFMPKASVSQAPLGGTDVISTSPYFYVDCSNLTIRTYNATNAYANITSVQLNNIYHFVSTRLGTAEVNYLNGVLTTGRTSPLGGQNNGFGVVGGYPLLNWYWNCGVYVIRIYNRVLSAQEVLQNFNATRGRFGI